MMHVHVERCSIGFFGAKPFDCCFRPRLKKMGKPRTMTPKGVIL